MNMNDLITSVLELYISIPASGASTKKTTPVQSQQGYWSILKLDYCLEIKSSKELSSGY